MDGMLHLTMPKELLGKKVRVTAQVEAADDPLGADQQTGWDGLGRIASRGGIASIKDPISWQREIRRDRSLPGREE